MTSASVLMASLVLAAALESGGDAAVRRGLTSGSWPWLVAGSAGLVLYGFVVNADRQVDFGALMGSYIAVFFVVSQLTALALVGTWPRPMTLAGGALIVLGGMLVQLGASAGR